MEKDSELVNSGDVAAVGEFPGHAQISIFAVAAIVGSLDLHQETRYQTFS